MAALGEGHRRLDVLAD